MIYINGIVSRRRNHELGLYSILGMTISDLGKMIFFIDAIMFAASSVLGLVFGATFVKFVGLGLKKLLDMGRFDIPVFSSVAAIIRVGYFAAVYRRRHRTWIRVCDCSQNEGFDGCRNELYAGRNPCRNRNLPGFHRIFDHLFEDAQKKQELLL